MPNLKLEQHRFWPKIRWEILWGNQRTAGRGHAQGCPPPDGTEQRGGSACHSHAEFPWNIPRRGLLILLTWLDFNQHRNTLPMQVVLILLFSCNRVPISSDISYVFCKCSVTDAFCLGSPTCFVSSVHPWQCPGFSFNYRIVSLTYFGYPTLHILGAFDENTTPSSWTSAKCPQVTEQRQKLLTISLVVYAQVHPRMVAAPNLSDVCAVWDAKIEERKKESIDILKPHQKSFIPWIPSMRSPGFLATSCLSQFGEVQVKLTTHHQRWRAGNQAINHPQSTYSSTKKPIRGKVDLSEPQHEAPLGSRNSHTLTLPLQRQLGVIFYEHLIKQLK